jgi:hypothetical protein
VNTACKALPFVIPALGADASALVLSYTARRNHPLLKALRGRSFDHFPPIYFPYGHADNPSALFDLPEVGYVSEGFTVLV